jgi:tRNA uridine 5-carboxymethylaminomethyl modification enzyme
MKLKKIYARPNITSDDILSLEKPLKYVQDNNLSADIIEQVEIQVKYSGYIEKEKINAEKLQNLENINIPKKFDYSKLKSLSSEAKSKLEDVRPKTLSQASRISGVSPSDISSILVHMGR